LNIFLAVMLVFTTLLSTNKEVFAAAAPSAIDVKNDGNGIAEVKDNEGNLLYKLTKTIKKADNVSRKATITIGAEGGTVKSSQSTDKSIDIVLIADTSGSMEDNDRIGTLKKALKETFESLKQLEDSNAALKGKIRVGLISFSGEANDISGGLQNINYFTNGGGNKKIDDLEAYGATYTDAALSKAKDVLKSSNNEKIVILMTDGAPTYSTKIKYYNKPEFYGKRVGNGADYDLSRWRRYTTEDYVDIRNNGHAGILRAKVLKKAGVTVYTVGIGADGINFQNYLESIASTPDKFYKDASNMSNFSSILKNILYKEISKPTISNETLTDIMGDKVNLISDLEGIKKSINVSVKNNDSEFAAKRKAEIKKAIEDNLKINNDTITIEKITLAEGESFTIKYDIEPDVDKLAETDYGKWLDANQSATLGQKVFPKPQIKVFMPELEIIKLDAENNKKLENAEFSLINKNGNLFVPYKMTQNGYENINGKITTDSNGTVKVNIPYGQYELKETKAPKDYLINKEEISLNVNDMEIIQEVRNTAIEKVQYSAHKTWQYVNEGELNSYEVEVGLYKEGNENQVIDTVILNGNETKQFKEVPKFTQDNKKITYVVKEIKVTKEGADFAYEQVGDAELNGNNVFELVNKPKKDSIEKVQYSAHKTWQYVNEGELNSYEVEVGLYKEGNENQVIDTVILNGNETKQFKEVPKFTQDNKKITYVVKEIKVTKEGADFAYEQVGDAELNGNNVFELVNKPQEQNIGKLTIKVTKEWLGVEDPSNLTAKIHLLENGDDIDNGDVKGNNSVTFTADKFDSDGKELTLDQIKEKYTISETNIPEGYKLDSVSEPSMDENGVVNYTVKNIVDGTVYRTLVAEKQWLNRDASPMSNEDAAKYQVKITVSKLVDGNITPLLDEEVKGDLTITGNGEIKFKVPAKDDKGDFIKYYLSEKVIGQVSYIQRTEDIKDPENKDQIQGLYGVKFINQLQDLTIKKLDGSNNNQALQGIDFTIVKDNDMISGTTNSDGVLVSNDSRVENGKISLSKGDYVVSEINPESMGYNKATTPVTLRVTTDSILIVNKDENGNEIRTTLLPNGVLKITDYLLGSEN
ncbi:MAG: SpaA isopeptide-forming pilin-related protein, partial [Bacteroidales bacterium]